jgi:N-acetylmuramic acid 6-phosphate etherase
LAENERNKTMKQWQADAKHFIENETQLHLGMLPTEQPHPNTRGLSDVLQADVHAGVRMLQAVDEDVAQAASRVLAEPAFAQLVSVLSDTLARDGRVYFSGCGATGRLSIMLEACWRHFWQDAAARCPAEASVCHSRGEQVGSIMTGGDYALIRSVEHFEDYLSFGRRQVTEAGVGPGDVLVAISEGGETSSVIGTVWEAHARGAKAFFVFNNPADVLAQHIERSREVIECPDIVCLDLTSGPMAVAGSTRMQATTSELVVVGAALDLALAAVLAESPVVREEVDPPALLESADYALAFRRLLTDLGTSQNVAAMADWTRFEEQIYSRNGLLTYFADECLLDIFTDTTERSPTFALPPFRQCDDTVSPPSWAFVKQPMLNTPDAWRRTLGREPRCLDWTSQTYAMLNASEELRLQPPRIDTNEIHKFLIGCEDDPSRYTAPTHVAVLTVFTSELGGSSAAAPAIVEAFAAVSDPFAARAAVVIGDRAPAIDGTGRLFHIACGLPATRLRLWERLAAKLVFNAVSTATMGRMGRLTSNWMAHVEASNKKLIDRGSRLVAELAGTDYEAACYALHETIEERRTALNQDQGRPSPVALTIEKLEQRRLRTK